MGISRKTGVLAVTVTLLGASGAWGLQVHGAETVRSGVGPSPAFQIAMPSSVMGAFAACKIGQLAAAMQKCPDVPDFVDDPANLTCDKFSDPSGEFKAALFETKSKNLTKVAASFKCKQTQAQAIQAQLECFSKAGAELKNSVETLKGQFQAGVQQLQGQYSTLKSEEADFEARAKDVERLLNGNGTVQDPGMVALQQQTGQAVDALKVGLQQFEQEQKAADNQEISLNKVATKYKMTKANQCFLEPEADFRCSPTAAGTPEKSTVDYIGCRFRQDLLTSTGQAAQNRSKAARNSAEEGERRLEALIKKIASNVPMVAKLPATPEEAQAAASLPGRILHPKDIERVYGREFAKFSGGEKIRKFVMDRYERCHALAELEVTNEESDPSSPLALSKTGLKTMRETTRTNINRELTKYSDLYTKGVGALTGAQLTIAPELCQSGKPALQLGCLKDLHKNLQGLMLGTVPNSFKQIRVKGTMQRPALDQPIKCEGLNGCVRVLQTMHSNLNTQKATKAAEKSSFKEKANGIIERKVEEISSMMRPQIQAITQSMSEIKMALGKLGADISFEDNPIERARLEGDENFDGMYRTPEDMLAVIAGGMPSVSPETLNGPIGALRERVAEFKEKEARAVEATGVMAALPGSCLNALVSKLRDRAATDLASLDTGKCVTRRSCENQYKSTLGRLSSDLSLVLGGLDNPGEVLSNGFNGKCNERTDNIVRLKQEEKDSKAALVRANTMLELWKKIEKEKEKPAPNDLQKLEQDKAKLLEANPTMTDPGSSTQADSDQKSAQGLVAEVTKALRSAEREYEQEIPATCAGIVNGIVKVYGTVPQLVRGALESTRGGGN